MMRHHLGVAGALAATILTGCTETGGGGSAAGSGGVIRAEQACDAAGLSRPLRQTLILVDAKAIRKAADGAAFARDDTAFRDLVLSIANPAKALGSGMSAARERVTIAVVPSDGSAAEVTFTGCLPGLSAGELAEANRTQSALSSAFSASPAGKLEDDAENFQRQLIGGMVAAAGKADGAPSAQTGAIASSPFLQGARASKSLLDVSGAVQRIVLVSDLSGLALPAGDDAQAFAAGVDAGRAANGDYGRAEVHVVLPAGRPTPSRAFLRGYFLAQAADLASVAAGRMGPPRTAPARLWRFGGEAAYPSGPRLVDIRIGDDGQGKLAYAWLTVLGDPPYPVPLGGQVVCTGADSCRIASDHSGFAQVWSGATGVSPRFDNRLPFGGMRDFAFQTNGGRLTGKVSDEAVYIGDDQNRNSIAVTAEVKR